MFNVPERFQMWKVKMHWNPESRVQSHLRWFSWKTHCRHTCTSNNIELVLWLLLKNQIHFEDGSPETWFNGFCFPSELRFRKVLEKHLANTVVHPNLCCPSSIAWHYGALLPPMWWKVPVQKHGPHHLEHKCLLGVLVCPHHVQWGPESSQQSCSQRPSGRPWARGGWYKILWHLISITWFKESKWFPPHSNEAGTGCPSMNQFPYRTVFLVCSHICELWWSSSSFAGQPVSMNPCPESWFSYCLSSPCAVSGMEIHTGPSTSQRCRPQEPHTWQCGNISRAWSNNQILYMVYIYIYTYPRWYI